ncbi:hypothetical protein SY83_08325 [Paenibacillus swuensis]|uniref:AraC family transcriptional regulator n=1 Tax=Paenibacillus swuensis TaxID=1178515 RepID=A0A172TP32_9BACL|nr:response regulator transcription factor [Paenibacillus swuensis]ANE48798.1 hypothetical protein SY83_08325 [Paenibacillus swuensis]
MSSEVLCKVLIVDDEILIRQGIKHYIHWEREGFEIVGEASNGQEALDIIEAKRPHIVITDMVMPIMDGEELTRVIKTAYPEIEVIVLSSFGEYNYVRSTFQSGVADYILKPKLEAEGLLHVLKAASSRIPSLRISAREPSLPFSPEQTLDRLLNGYEVADQDMDMAERTFPHARYVLAGIEPESAKGDWEKFVRNKLPLTVIYPLKPFSSTATYILNAGQAEMDQCSAVMQAFTQEVPEACFLLSPAFDELHEVSKIYKDDLSKLQQYRFYFPDLHLLSGSLLPKPAPRAEAFDLNRFMMKFKRERTDDALAYLDDHINALSLCYTMDVFEYKSFLSNIIFNITVLLSSMNYKIQALEEAKYSYFKAMDEARHVGEALKLWHQFMDEVHRHMASETQPAGNGNMKMLLNYIEEHYAEPLSLTEVARHFHFNPSYLSSYFTAHNKEGFIEYVNKIRIEKASDLLITEAAPISEISGLVGYADHSYFCKVFKRITGVSPSQYRKQHLR